MSKWCSCAAQYHGVVCIRSSRSLRWVSMWRSKWITPIFLPKPFITPRDVGNPIEWSPPRITGNTPFDRMCSTPFVIWSKAFSMFAGVTKMSPTSTMSSCSRRSMPSS